MLKFQDFVLKGIYPEFQVIRGFSQKIPAGLLSYDQIHSYLTFRVDIEGYFVELRQNDPSRNIRRRSSYLNEHPRTEYVTCCVSPFSHGHMAATRVWSSPY